MIEIELPWPPSVLSPNARVHWSKRSKAAKAYRHACWALVKQAGLPAMPDGELHLWITFYPPDRRHRDDDNMIASFKSGRDGLADALGVDDKRFRLHPWVSDQIGGKVKVRISAGPAESGSNSTPPASKAA